MANEDQPNRARQLRDAIASKLREKADHEPGAPPAPAPPRPAPAAPEPEGGVSAVEMAKHILRTQISFRGPSLNDLAYLCRQLATLIDVGIPLLRTLKILSERTQHPRLRQTMKEVASDVEQGSPLSTALSRHPQIIPPLIVNITRIGEAGGILERALRRLAEIYERRADIKRKVWASLLYPIAAVTVAISVVILIFAYAIPVFQQVYEQKEGAQLPAITQQVIAMSVFVRTMWPLYVPLAIGLLVALVLWGRTPRGRRLFDGLRLRLPIMGPLNTKINVARFTRTLSSLLAAGIPLIEALGSTAQSSDNVVLAEALMKTRESVEGGGKLEESMRAAPVFPPIVVDMIAIGDEAGALDEILDRMANVYESEVDTALRGLVALIEPLLIIFLGFTVLVIAFAILLPYWNIGDLIE